MTIPTHIIPSDQQQVVDAAKELTPNKGTYDERMAITGKTFLDLSGVKTEQVPEVTSGVETTSQAPVVPPPVA